MATWIERTGIALLFCWSAPCNTKLELYTGGHRFPQAAHGSNDRSKLMPPRIDLRVYSIPQAGEVGQDHRQKEKRPASNRLQLASDHFGTE
ncbi:hypothetical protein D3C73_883040 [compost metagenome]